MAKITSVGQLRLRKIMPEGFKDIDRPLNSKELGNVMTEMAKTVPSSTYVSVLKDLTNFGHEVANDYGGIASAHLSDLTIPPELKTMRRMLEKKVYDISQRTDIDSATKKHKIISIVREATPIIDKAVMEALKNSNNSFGLLVGTGIKGKPQQLRQLIFGDLLTVDSKMKDIPYPTFRSYGEGITPLQYWTASHGGRYGYIQVQKATADAGYFSKQTRGVVHRQIITMDDCGRARGYLADSDDSDIIGSLLFRDTKGKSGKVYEKDSIITEDMMEDLKGRVMIRSAVCCGAGDGVCSKCAGVRESGRLPDIGDAVGLNGINAGNEQITQMGLCLHEDTLVRMADGTSKAIKDISAGELVTASDMQGKQYPAKVINNHYNGVKQVNRFLFYDAQTDLEAELICTPEHKVLHRKIGVTETGISPIGQIFTYVPVVLSGLPQDSIKAIGRTSYGFVDTYDLELDTPEHLFVLANGLVVSNSSKHSGGESVSAKRVKRGFAAVDQFINMPENFVGGASVATKDGKITSIDDAPQGGKHVKIGDETVYVPTGAELTVKAGDYVEAGDLISDGMPNIEEITKYKGLGAGRKAFVTALAELMESNGAAVPKKQIEPFARAYIDRVEITDPDGLQGWIYGDIAGYNILEKRWKPRVGAFAAKPASAVGRYLELPVLHYTIGTRITPTVVKDLQEAGIDSITVHNDEAPFKPHMTSAKQFNSDDPDWITSLSGEGLTKSFLKHVQQGSVSTKNSTSYYPDLAFIGTSGEKQLKL